jgi:hypothetical protein
LTVVLPALVLAFYGCSDGRKVATPPACLTAESTWVTALADAPQQVLLDGNTTISSCLPKYQSAAQHEEVGKSAVASATQLAVFYKGGGKSEEGNPSASARQAALMAGYLVGALTRGAEETEGVHEALVNRVEAAATNGLEEAGHGLQDAYRQGHEAGLKNG